MAEHKFSLCDSARALGLQKQTWRRYSNKFICSMPALSELFVFIIEHSVLIVLVSYLKDMLEGKTAQRTH